MNVRGQISAWEPSLNIHDVVIIFAFELTPMNTVAEGQFFVYNTELNAIDCRLSHLAFYLLVS
jgi:hypothetical protein